MQVGFLGSADSWYYSDLLRASSSDERLLPIRFTDLCGRCGSCPDRDSDQVGGTAAGSSAARWFAGGVDLMTLDALLVRTMPPGSLEEIVFRMDILGCYQRQGGLVVNPPRAVEVAVDKYLATCRLDMAGIPVPRTIVCQNVEEARNAYQELGGDVVLKPLFGGEGRGLMRLTTPDSAERAFQTHRQSESVLYLQEFIEHGGFDIRVLLIGDEAFAMRRCNDQDWRTNVSRGARTEPVKLTAELLTLARQAASVIEAPLAGVDVLLAPSGQPYVLEVNAVPGWKALARTVGVDISRCVWDYLAAEVDR